MKKTIIPALTAILLSSAGCEWTEPVHKDYVLPTPEETDPTAYEARLSSVRAYKKSEHKVMILGMEGTSEYPVLQSQHIMSMPDSADYIYVKNAENLHPVIVDEIREVREKKGTGVLSCVDFNITDAEWLLEKNRRNDEGLPYPTEEDCKAFFKTGAERQIALCDRYGFEGIVLSYFGNILSDDTNVNMPEEKKICRDAFMKVVSDWKNDNPDRLMFFRGNFNNAPDAGFWSSSRYLVVVLNGASGVVNYKSILRNLFTNSDMHQYRDRVVLEVSVPSTEEPVQSGDRPNEAAKNIQKEITPYKILGLSVDNASDDYFNQKYTIMEEGKDKDIIVGNFANIRPGITALNPAE